ncbi:unnamed protein product (macronuclear) [Paramecium tetraurelia]|uniref:Serine aminopeptidase S33 domain-containing protein n=1 Tax=Paramecium tetraurelia TaxID=5888 RepID=A0DFK3_PARTE|nr:uncharacterized protein GSPATT00016633001 [Paramecium tetraurelia]CAK81820.1 unnamed protein product [Paramecium tetraurelia]|eukprot:XP_001449217.1 hypothetical protein (macronuclear) [Paramecium tetraurelia strain d4-2]
MNQTFTAEIKLKSSKERGYFDQLVDAVVRPPRQIYDPSKLGATTVLINKLLIYREDFVVQSRQQNLKLQGSLYSPVYLKGKASPCIIYLHGNSSSRLESSCYANMLAQEGMSLVNFDFGGCGISDGQYVSLGWYEKEDFLNILNYIKTKYQISTKRYPQLGPFGVWGRSMGAVTAIMAAAENPELSTLVLDSPFSNLKQLCIDIGDSFHVPTIGVRFVFYLLRKKVRKIVRYDPKHINTIQYIKKLSTKCSAYFVRASSDKMIGKNHVENLYDAFKGEKYIFTFLGDHNAPRPTEAYQGIIRFFATRLIKSTEIQKMSLSRKSSGKSHKIEKGYKSQRSYESDVNYDESDDENAKKLNNEQYITEMKKPQLLNVFLSDSDIDSQHSLDEDLKDHDLPQFQDIKTKLS